ncbi:MAG: DUF6057 family protein [Breznakibacter sp.]
MRTPKHNTGKPPHIPDVRLSDPRTYSPWWYAIAFLFVAMHLTAVRNGFFLKWAEGLSLFVPTAAYFAGCMAAPGGLLVYAGTFLIQLFHFPVWGSVAFAGLLFVVQQLSVSAFRIPRAYYPLSFVPGMMLLLSVTQLGYVWATLKSPGYFFSNTLGVIAALLGLAIYRQLASRPFRAAALCAVVAAGYPLFGFYALFSGFLCLGVELAAYAADKHARRFVPVAVAALLIGLVPQLFYRHVYSHLQHVLLYVSGLPRFEFTVKELVLWLPFIVLFASLPLFVLLRQTGNGRNRTAAASSSGVFAATVILAYSLTYDNENFRAEIKMNDAMEHNDWGRVAAIARNLRGEPTRSIVLNQSLALTALGRTGGQRAEPARTVRPDCVRPPTPLTIEMGGRPFYYHTGRINDCYHWCMEDMVEYGMRVSYLKYMVKCAIVGEEYALARKYNAVLAGTLFHKDWARRYQAYIDRPRLAAADDEIRRIRALLARDASVAEP